MKFYQLPTQIIISLYSYIIVFLLLERNNKDDFFLFPHIPFGNIPTQ